MELHEYQLLNWYFNCEMKRVEQSGQMSIKHFFLEPAAYGEEMVRERREQMRVQQ